MGEKIQSLFKDVRKEKGEIGVRKLVNRTSIDEEKAGKVDDKKHLDKVRKAKQKILNQRFKPGEKE